jgi:hypothetical protein
MNFFCWVVGLLFVNSFSGTVSLCLDNNKDFDQEAALSGTWRGRSICVDRSGGCHDEEVIYHIKQAAGSPEVNIDADKIVDGKAVNMGMLVFTYDKKKGLLTSNAGKNLWQLTVNGNQIEGMLLRDGEIFRKMGLKKD